MNKADFIAAINQATLLQNCYTDKKRMVAMWDELWNELKGESEEDLLNALKRIGKSDKTINYFNIKGLIDEGRDKVWEDTVKESEPMPPKAREAIAKLKGKWR